MNGWFWSCSGDTVYHGSRGQINGVEALQHAFLDDVKSRDKSSEHIPDFRGSLHIVARYLEDEFPWAKSICFHP